MVVIAGTEDDVCASWQSLDGVADLAEAGYAVELVKIERGRSPIRGLQRRQHGHCRSSGKEDCGHLADTGRREQQNSLPITAGTQTWEDLRAARRIGKVREV